MSRLRDIRGQATVEVVVLAPLVIAVAVAVACVLGAGAASEAAGAAAGAGAAAVVQERDPDAAAQAALGTVPRSRATIEVSGRRVTVTVRPGVVPRPLAQVLAATAHADAGPGAAVERSSTILRGGDGESSRPSE